MQSPGQIRHRQRLCSTSVATVTLVMLLIAPCVAQTQSPRPERRPVDVASSASGVVVSETPLASDVGREVLAKGGNAVDAAVATAFALAVTWPEAGNIGGGGFMMIAPPDEGVVCVDYRETAPHSADVNSFREWKNRRHARMAGVPGTVHGLANAHKRYGKIAWQTIVAPAAKLARDGFIVDRHLAYSLNAVLQLTVTQLDARYAEFRRVYGHPNGRPWRAGDTIVQPDLANTLDSIAQGGPDAFYTGSIAKQVVREMKTGDGLISAADLAGYTSKIRPAYHGDVRGFTVYGAPLPSSGGATVIMQLRMIDALGLKSDSQQYWTTEHVHKMTEVMRRAFRERAAHMGDADFIQIPKRIFSPGHAINLANSIRAERATPSHEIAGDIELTPGPYESNETTHFSVVDANGMAVSNTYTLEGTFGSRIVVRGAGFLLNNEMGDFNWIPGYTNLEGRIGTPPNRIAPGKRMLSSQSPTVVKKDGRVVLVLGSPGGRTIINTVTQIAVQTLFFKRSLAEAIDGPRFHHQWLPDLIKFESDDQGLFSDMAATLSEMGHATEQRLDSRQGSANAIVIDLESQTATGVADWRRGAAARAVAED